MRLDSALAHTRNHGDVVYALSLHQLEHHAGALGVGKERQRMAQVHLQSAVGVSPTAPHHRGRFQRVGRVLRLHVVVVHIVCYAKQPRAERRLSTKAGDVEIGFDEGVLGQVVAQLGVAQRLAEEEATHLGLVFLNQPPEGCPVVEYRRLGNPCYVFEISHVALSIYNNVVTGCRSLRRAVRRCGGHPWCAR